MALINSFGQSVLSGFIFYGSGWGLFATRGEAAAAIGIAVFLGS